MQYGDIGKFIKSKRIEAGKTLNSFAFFNYIDPAILSRIENGKQDIKLNILIKIADGFGLTPAEFLAEYEQSL